MNTIREKEKKFRNSQDTSDFLNIFSLKFSILSSQIYFSISKKTIINNNNVSLKQKSYRRSTYLFYRTRIRKQNSSRLVPPYFMDRTNQFSLSHTRFKNTVSQMRGATVPVTIWYRVERRSIILHMHYYVWNNRGGERGHSW